MPDDLQNKPPEKRKRGNPAMVKGAPSLNPGGRPKKLVEIEKMLDAEHRDVDKVKEVFAQLRALATENIITHWTDKEGNEHESQKQPNPAFMAMYLDRILGPVKALQVDMSDWPDEIVAFVVEHAN